MDRRVIVFVSVLIAMFLLAVLFEVGFWRYGEVVATSFEPYVILHPYESNGFKSLLADHPRNFSWVLQDLDVAKSLGFKGVSIMNLECLVYEGLLDDLLDAAKSRGLHVILHIWWFDLTWKYDGSYPPNWARNRGGFPDNTTQVLAFIDFVANVSKTAKQYVNVDGYVLFYPMDWPTNATDWRERARKKSYRDNLQLIINAIRENDGWHDIYLASNMYEEPFAMGTECLPYNFSGINGFAFTYYSLNYNQLNQTHLEWYYEFFKNKSETYADGKVMITEWGWRTKGKWAHGKCANKQMKCKLIEQSFMVMYSWKVKWSYFSLHDFIGFLGENADWGLINSDHTIRCSGEKMAQLIFNYVKPYHYFRTDFSTIQGFNDWFLSSNVNFSCATFNTPTFIKSLDETIQHVTFFHIQKQTKE